MAKTDRKAALFFLGSLLLTPTGYLVGTSFGGLLARGVAGLSTSEMTSSPKAMLLVFGGAGVVISALHLLLFLCMAPRSSTRLPNTPQQPASAPSGARG